MKGRDHLEDLDLDSEGKIILKWILTRLQGVDTIDPSSGWRQVVSSCECANELPASIKLGNFLTR
jgi:hypothetical protein